jgi:predicted ATP-grasp superfamily ATP-dependent carboligase
MTRYVNPAIVIGGGYNALGVIRNLGQQGVDAYCVLPNQDQFAQVSKYCQGYAVVPRLEDDPETMRQWLNTVTRQAPYPCYIHPTSDLSVLTLSRLLPQLPHCLASIPPVEAVETCVIKRRFYQSLAAQGIPHPTTVYSDDGALDDSSSQLRYPVYIKPSISQIFEQVFGRKGFVAQNRQELHALLQRVAAQDLEVMVQEIIPGPMTNDYIIRGYYNQASRLMGVFAMQTVRSQPFSVSSALVSVPLCDVAEFAPIITDYLAALYYRGVFMAEFKRDARDGRFKLLEVNARSGGGNAHARLCQFNHILLAYREAIGLPIAPIRQYLPQVYTMDVLSDLRTVALRLQQRNLSWHDVIRSYALPHNDWLFQRDDLMPFLKYLQFLVTTKIHEPVRQKLMTQTHAR